MSTQRNTPDTIARAQELIGRIRGISSCRISTDESGEITEVHVVATDAKPAKLVARDVETCLQAEFGIQVDYKKIGVVTYETPDVDSEEPEPETQRQVPTSLPEDVIELSIEEHPSRFAFQSVNLFISHEKVQAEVELVRDGNETLGRASSSNIVFPLNVIAEATLNAVGDLLDGSFRLCLSGVHEVELNEQAAVIVTVCLVKQREKINLAGCSLAVENVNQTVVFATMDAVNRVLGKLGATSSVEYRIT